MSQCSSKYVNQFCTKYLNINLNFALATGPTIDIALLGEPPQGFDEVDQEYVKTVIKDLQSYGLPLEGSWEIVQISTSKSSSGVITNLRLIDGKWLEFETTEVGLTTQSHGDIMIGREFFNVTGIPYNVWGAGAKNIMISGSFYRKYYSDLNRGLKFVTNKGSIVDTPSNISVDNFVDSLVPGLPDPYVDFGNFYYRFDELMDKKVNGVELGSLINQGNAAFPGLFNFDGTLNSVLSAIAAQFGKLFISNNLYDRQFFELSEDFGKKDVLVNANIQVPDEAISSIESRDYSSGYSQEAAIHIKTPGRYPTEPETEEVDDDNPQYYAPPATITENHNDRFTTSSYISIKELYGLDGYNDSQLEDAVTYETLKGDPFLEEYGLYLFIKQNCQEAQDQAYYKRTYTQVPEGYKFYYGADQVAKVTNDQAISLAVQSLGLGEGKDVIDAGVDISLIIQYFQNKNRFAYYTGTGSGKISENGNSTGINEMYSTGSYASIGFYNYGTARNPTGSKEWAAYVNNQEVGITFVRESNASQTISNMVGAPSGSTFSFNVDTKDEPTTGALVIDTGANSLELPSAQEFPDYEALSVWVDLNPAILKEGNQSRGIVAINDSFENLSNDVTFFSAPSSSTDAVEIQSWGVSTRQLLSLRTGAGPKSKSQARDYEPSTVNKYPRIIRSFYKNVCLPADPHNSISKAHLLNRNILNYKADFVWDDGKYINNEQIKRVYENGKWYKVIVANNTREEIDIKYLDQENSNERRAYYAACENNVTVPYLEKINFSLINKFYNMNKTQVKYLEGLTITVTGGKVQASYTFSQKVVIPDYKGLVASKVSLQNTLGA